MSNGANITIVGNITKDPELRFAASGVAWATFSVAVNERSRSKEGDWTDQTTYFNCKVWRNDAENLVESVTKGTRVMVEGKLRDESWTDASGQERKTKTLVVSEIGVSLKYATAQITKVARANAGEQTGSYSSDEPSISDEPEDNPFL
jgi:single-strand DNA-binding protein